MASLATDDFNRANSGTLGANWTGTTGAAARFSIVSNQAKNNGTTITLDSYTGTSAPANQYSKITLKTILGVSDEGPGPAVRVSTAAVTAYFAQCNTVEIKLYKVVSGSFTQLGSDAAAAANNDVVEIDANGTSITVKKNGSTVIGPITDSAISTGNWGLWCAGPAASAVAFDDWEGGDFTSAVYTKGNFLGFM